MIEAPAGLERAECGAGGPLDGLGTQRDGRDESHLTIALYDGVGPVRVGRGGFAGEEVRWGGGALGRWCGGRPSYETTPTVGFPRVGVGSVGSFEAVGFLGYDSFTDIEDAHGLTLVVHDSH